jgi:hypothetical protein
MRNTNSTASRPSGILIAAGDRPESVGAYRYSGEIALIAAALARGDRFADQRLRQRHQPAATEALHYAKDRQHQDAGSQGA